MTTSTQRPQKCVHHNGNMWMLTHGMATLAVLAALAHGAQDSKLQGSGGKGTLTLTSDSGIPVADNQNSITAGPRGPLLVEDWQLFEKHGHFNRERIAERVVHAKGVGVFGTFRTTKDITKYTIADPFSEVGKETPVLVRFSTVAGERGAADAERDVRGFAIKLYTKRGNWDLVGNNTPVFFVRDPWKFSDFIRTQKRDRHTNLRNATSILDFWSLDRGIPYSMRHQNGYGSHTYSMINADGKRVWVKFHFISQQGLKHMTSAEAEAVVAKDRESSQRDLFYSIETGDYPKWTLKIQTMTEAEALNTTFNPFDLTRKWPEDKWPLQEVGVMELVRNPDNYFAQMETASFSPSNVIPGISFSPDRMLQFRIFSYADAHRYRLGVNYEHIPFNCPLVSVNNYARDGLGRHDANRGSSVNYDYEPNSFQIGGPKHAGNGKNGHLQVPLPLDGQPPARYGHRADSDDYEQPGELYRSMTDDEKDRLISNLAEATTGVPEDIQRRQIAHFAKADKEWGKRVQDALGLKGKRSSRRHTRDV